MNQQSKYVVRESIECGCKVYEVVDTETGKLCSMCDFTTIERGEKYITIQHDETGLVVAYTSEERLNVKH